MNSYARQGYNVSIADPVALYINNWDTSTFKLDVSGSQTGSQLQAVPSSWYQVVRGDLSKQQGLRLRVSNMTGAKTSDGSRLLTVSDIYDTANSTNVLYGAQFTDYIHMGVAGVVTNGKEAPSVPCVGVHSDPQTAHTISKKHKRRWSKKL